MAAWSRPTFPGSSFRLENPLMKAEEEGEEDQQQKQQQNADRPSNFSGIVLRFKSPPRSDREVQQHGQARRRSPSVTPPLPGAVLTSHFSSGHHSDDEEPDPSTSPPAAKRRKKTPEPKPPKPCPLDLSEVPMNLPPIPSDRPGSASRFKGVYKHYKKWAARISILSEGGEVRLGTFESEEEAGIMYARARYKYPVEEAKPCPLDLSDVPMNLPPIPSDRPGSASRFKGVTKSGKKWVAAIGIPSEGGEVHLGTFDSEEEAGIMFARARYKYPVEEPRPCPLDLSEVPLNLPPIPSDRPGSASRFKGVSKNGKKWQAQISILSEGGKVKLGTFDSEEEAGIMYARARYKYPVQEPKPCPLDLSEVPMNLLPIPSSTPGSSSRFKGVRKNAKKWQARIDIPSEGDVYLGTFDSEEEAGIMYARARCKYPVQVGRDAR